MEVLIITAVQSFEQDIKQLLKENRVTAFSYLDVTGYKDVSHDAVEENWFATNAGEHQSSLFYVFLDSAKVDQVLESIEQFNAELDSASHVHAVALNVKKSI